MKGIEMELFPPAPHNRAEDERRITARYKDIGWDFARHGLPLALLAYFLDTKWICAYGFFIVALGIGALDARLHDFLVRVRRIDQERRDGISN